MSRLEHVLVLTLLLAMACDYFPLDKLGAAFGEPTVQTLTLDPKTSHIEISILKVASEHTARVERFDATIELLGLNLRRFETTVHLSSLVTDNDTLTQDLWSAELLDIERFPTASFESTSVQEKLNGTATHELLGEMLFHGVSQELRFPARLKIQDRRLIGDVAIELDPRDFGIDSQIIDAELEGQPITLTIHLEFPLTPSTTEKTP